MKNEKLIKKLQEIITSIEQTETSVHAKNQFSDEENQEDLLDCLASAIVSLEESVEIIERDRELDKMNDAVESSDE